MNILIIEDDDFLARRIKQVFERTVITNRITVLYSYEEFISHIGDISYYDIILTDI
jgi:CheY-like chemotaxis protein